MVAKKAIKAADDLGVTEGLKYEKAVFQPLFSTKSAKEGVTAFMEKRPPNFKDL